MTPEQYQKALENPLLTRTGEFDLRLDFQESRISRLEGQIHDHHDEIMCAMGQLQADVAHLSGRVTGAMMAGGLLGAAVAFLAQLVIRAR